MLQKYALQVNDGTLKPAKRVSHDEFLDRVGIEVGLKEVVKVL